MEAVVDSDRQKADRTDKDMPMETDEDDKITELLSIDTSETETVSIDGDRMSVKSQDSSTALKKPSSGNSTPSDKRCASPPQSTSKTGPHHSGSKQGRPIPDGGQSPDMHPNRPNRPGIIWKVNGKLEAMDFQKKWYPARIVDMDDNDNTALIHFDGWNQRYDEWVSMNSERLRPLTRTSGRKDKKMTKKSSAKLEHKIGDNVFAKWTDCRMYAGTIVGITPNESYEVRFYDGFRKTVQPINVKAMSLQVQKEYAVAGMLPHPSARPYQKIQMLERKAASEEYKRAFKQTKFEKKAPRAGSQSTDEVTSSTDKVKATVSGMESAMQHAARSSKLGLNKLKRRHKHKGSMMCKTLEDRPPLKKRKLVVGGKFQVKKIKDRSVRIQTTDKEQKKRTKRKQCILKMRSRRAVKGHDGCGTRKRKYKGYPSKRLFSKPELTTSQGAKSVNPKCDRGEQTADVKDSEIETPAPCTAPSTGHDIKKEDDFSDDDVVLAELIKCTPAPPSGTQQKNVHMSSTTTPAAKHVKPAVTVPDQDQDVSNPEVAKKGFLATPEQKFTCPFSNCNKSFRKTSLVECHVKYYHTEDGNVVQPQPPRKRRKTSSICSSDSEVSFPLKQGRPLPASKKHKDNVLPVLQSAEVTEDSSGVINVDDSVKQEVVEETGTTITSEPDHKDTVAVDNSDITGDVNADCLNKDEVVNCICQLNEENGLMIQCEVCLCWQHAVCMELTEETLPTKYICYICSNPPGIRDSARYSYDQDWLKQGSMARFNFLPEDPHVKQKAHIMLATHNLVSDLHGVNQALKSLQCQLHASKDSNHPEVKLWTRNWDRRVQNPEQNERSNMQNPGLQETVNMVPETVVSSCISVSDSIKLSKNEKMNSQESTDITAINEDMSNMRRLCPDITQEPNSDNSKMKQEGSEEVFDPWKSRLLTNKQENDEVAAVMEQQVKEEKVPLKHHTGISEETALTKPDITKEETDTHDISLCGVDHKAENIKEMVSDSCQKSVDQDKDDKPSGLEERRVTSQDDEVDGKDGSSERKSTEKSDVSTDHDVLIKDGSNTASEKNVKETSSLETPHLITISENMSSSSLSSLNEDIQPSLSNQTVKQAGSVLAVKEEPFVSCEQNLLEHICDMQSNLGYRLDLIEEQISVLENADCNGNGSSSHDGDVLHDLPRVKKTLHQILNDLFRVKRMALYR